ncbi:MAG: murein biosynthesis integral membrane protein MurJ [Chloroflexi bacterium HGW-Chloroflexi-10]|nr:MAG: murein biosynthesis integral membrane protein MurJ [Chloroflexi bacterium HGW-Chloroflexi-10]
MVPSAAQQSQSNANHQIARAAGTVFIAYVLGSVINVVRGVVILRTFGTAMDHEAFTAANRVAETLFNLVAGGALASAFIPTFTALLVQKDKEGAWKLASAIVNLVLIIVSVLASLAAFFAPQTVTSLLAPGFVNDSEKFELTVQLLRVILPSAVIFSISGLVMGMLNAHQSFLIPALAPSLYSLGMILGVWLLSPVLGIFGLAWGVVIGAALHLMVQIPKLLRLGGRFFPTLGLRNPVVKEVGIMMAPRLVGAAVVQLNFWVNTRLASYYSEGSVTGLTYGFILMMMALQLLAQTIGIAILPTFSIQVALGKMDEMRSSLASALRALLLLSVPASLGLILLRYPLVRFLYEDGVTFNAGSTDLIAWALLWYAAGLVGHSLLEVLSRAFYAMHDTRTPVIVGVGAMTLNILLSIVLGNAFVRIGWMPHGGLALANSIATGLESIVLLFLMRKRLKGLDGSRIVAAVWRALLAATCMGLGIWYFLQFASAWLPVFQVIVGIVAGGSIYGILLMALRVYEVQYLWKLIHKRVLARFVR